MKHTATQYGLGLSSTESRPKVSLAWGKAHKSNVSRKTKRSARGVVPLPRRKSINMDLLTDEMSDWLLSKLGLKPSVKDITEG